MSKWFAGISPTAKALAALAVAAGVGVTCSGLWEVPAQVDINVQDIANNGVQIHEIREQGESVEQKIDRVICLQLLETDGNPLSCP